MEGAGLSTRFQGLTIQDPGDNVEERLSELTLARPKRRFVDTTLDDVPSEKRSRRGHLLAVQLPPDSAVLEKRRAILIAEGLRAVLTRIEAKVAQTGMPVRKERDKISIVDHGPDRVVLNVDVFWELPRLADANMRRKITMFVRQLKEELGQPPESDWVMWEE